MMKPVEIILLLSSILLVYSTDFGQATFQLMGINGGTATIKLFTENSGTTSSSNVKILGLYLSCKPSFYELTCETRTALSLSSSGTEIQCSISSEITTACTLDDTSPSIISGEDSFSFQGGTVPAISKFGTTTISLVSVEGRNVVISIAVERREETATDGLFITDLTVNSKDLTCEAGKKLILETGGTKMNCTTTEEIDANTDCILGGNPKIISPQDSFGTIKYSTAKVVSSFGLVQIGILSAKGTTITIEIKSEYKASKSKSIDVSGLQINSTRSLNCPSSTLTLTKEGTPIECTISPGVEEEDYCLLTQSNLHSDALPNIQINPNKNYCIARSSKFGKVQISLSSVLDKKIIIIIKPTFDGQTESSQFSIDNLQLRCDNRDYTMTCSKYNRITLEHSGTDFDCSINTRINGGIECNLKGTPSFNSPGDTFSDITITPGSVFSSFGKITITPVSVEGQTVIIKLTSEITGITSSSVASIDNLKIGERDLTCSLGVNINFSERPEYNCTLAQAMEGNVNVQLRGNSPTIVKATGSNDVFGEIVLSTNTITSKFGTLELNLVSVTADNVVVNLKSQYTGSITDLNIYNLYLNGQKINCYSNGASLTLLNSDGTSNANIQCTFDSSYYSQQTNTPCTLTGRPSVSMKLFTTIYINTNQVTSGTRNFGETIIYLDSIQGTTVYIQIKPSLSGKVRPYIKNLKLQGGSTEYDVKCDVADQIQLYKDSSVSIKCYIQSSIDQNTACNLINGGVTIETDNGDTFGNIVISTEPYYSNKYPSASSFGNTQIKLTSIVGTQVNINIMVSSTTYYSSVSPVIYGLSLGSSQLYCVSSQTLTFYNNMTQMSCTSSSEITCGSNCQLSGTPTIVSSGSQEATFGTTVIENTVVQATSSTLGNISIKLKEVTGNIVYLGVTSTQEGTSYQETEISNLYVDGQLLTCIENIKFSTTETKVKCTVKEAIPYNKVVSLTGTPSIRIDSTTESVDLVNLSSDNIEITAKSNSAIVLELISVKENIATITITATDLNKRTTFTNFLMTGMAINNCPFEIREEEVTLSNNPYTVKVRLNETFERDVPCTLNGVSTAQMVADETTFGPLTNSASNTIYSTSFKFGEGTVTLLYVQGYSVILRVTSTKTDYTRNTVISGLYINDNLPLTCQIKNDLEFNLYGTDVECKLAEAMAPDVLCRLSYKGEIDDNFESLSVNYNYVYSTYKEFGEVSIGLVEVSGLNVKILVNTSYHNTTTTNNVQIKNLYVNNKEIICEYNDYIEFVTSGTVLDCKLSSSDSSETFTLSGNNIEIISLADNFGHTRIDESKKSVRTSPKEIEGARISLSCVAGNKAIIKFSTPVEVYTYVTLKNLRLKNNEYSNTYDLTCPKKYLNLNERNNYIDYIQCEIATTLAIGVSLSLENNPNEIDIESYDHFEEINIDTSETVSTKFGDIKFGLYSSSIVLILYPTNQGTINYPSYMNNVQLNSLLGLDCKIPENTELKETGTMIYCTLKGTNFLDESNIASVYMEFEEDYSYNNIYLLKEQNNLKSPNCYAIYDKTSCEINSNCVFSKDTYGFCLKKLNSNNTNEIEGQNNECLLYLNEDGCNSDDKCVWSKESKYTCKTRTIENCNKLTQFNQLDLFTCEECVLGFELNSNQTKCISSNGSFYRCNEYNNAEKCDSKPQCEYSYNYYYYCASINQTVFDNSKCYLYITEKSCNSQAQCSWMYNDDSGCREKRIENCAKLLESDPTTCEKCEDGYHLSLGKICSKQVLNAKEECDKYSDEEEECLNMPYCEFSSRANCYGENQNCYLYLDKSLCENNEGCHWNPGNWDKCQVKYIANCLTLSNEDPSICAVCSNGYSWSEYEGACMANEDCEDCQETPGFSDIPVILSTCYEYSTDERMCKYNTKCQFTQRSFCDNRYAYSFNKQCYLYLDQAKCEENKECFWNEDQVKICHIKAISDCAKLKSHDTEKCEICKDGYNLGDGKCQSGGLMISLSLWAFALIMLLI